jgi:hypothetical protein
MTDNAAIYISDPTLLGTKFFGKFGEIKSYESLQEGDHATGLAIDLGFSKIQMNFMPSDKVLTHLNGFEGYIQTVGCKDDDTLLYTLSRLRQVQFVIGCVINPNFDKEGKTIRFLMDFAGKLNGLVFIHNSVVDYDGETLVKPS